MRHLFVFGVIGALSILLSDPLAARGPGGGGRGGGGGRIGGGGGVGGGGMSRPSAGRTPSLGGSGLSRPGGSGPGGSGFSGAGGGLNRPGGGGIGGGLGDRPTPKPSPGPGHVGSQVGNRPNAGQLNQFLDVPRPSTLPANSGLANRPNTGSIGGAIAGGGLSGGGAAADFLRDTAGGRPATLPAERPGIANRPETLPGRRPGAADNRPGTADNRPNRIENRQNWFDNRQQRHDEVLGQVNVDNRHFNFWNDHPHWGAWGIRNPYRWCTWGTLTSWLPWGWTTPIAYSYGDNVYYVENQVYYGDQAVASAEEYVQQAERILSNVPTKTPGEGEWLPLGIFALTQDGSPSGSEPTIFQQLAVSKSGVIAGTMHNESTGQTQVLEGMIDKQTQRAAWGVKGKSRPILESGVNNLTQDSAPVLLHFADGKTQQWLMVRLPEPKGK